MDIFVIIYFIVISALFGVVIGSFLNVVIYRVPAGRTIVKGHSMCMTCGHNLAAKDLIPIISWASLKGKCRYCGAPIASRYTKIESFTGVAFLIAAVCSYRFAAPALVVFDYPEYIFGLCYFIMYVLALACAISAMMIYYDTGKNYLGTAVWAFVFRVIAILLPFIFGVLSDRKGFVAALTSLGMNLLQFAAAVAICALLSFIICRKYSLSDLYLDLTICSLPQNTMYFYFVNQWVEYLSFAVIYGLMRAVLKKTPKDKYSGIISVCFLLLVSLAHYIYRIIITG